MRRLIQRSKPLLNLKKHKMFKLPIYNKTEMRLMFEYGYMLGEVAKNRNVELTSEILQRCEDIVLKELKIKNWKQVVLETVPNVLASFETK